MESPSHADDVAFAKHGEDHWQASLEAEGGDLSRDVVLAYHTARPRTGVDLIASREQGEDGPTEQAVRGSIQCRQPSARQDRRRNRFSTIRKSVGFSIRSNVSRI